MKHSCNLMTLAVAAFALTSLQACAKQKDASSNGLEGLTVPELLVVYDDFAKELGKGAPTYTSEQIWTELTSRWPEDQEEFIQHASRTTDASHIRTLVYAALDSGRAGESKALIEAGAFRKASTYEHGRESLRAVSDAIQDYLASSQGSMSDDEIADYIVRLKNFEPEYTRFIDKMLRDLPQSRQTSIKRKIR